MLQVGVNITKYTVAVTLATDDDKQRKSYNKSVMLKSLGSLTMMTLRRTRKHWMIIDKAKVRELILSVLLKLFIFKPFRLGFNFYNITNIRFSQGRSLS